MNIAQGFAGRTVKFKTAALLFLAALFPSILGVAIPISRLLSQTDSVGWKRGIFEWVSIPPEAKLILITGYVFVVAVILVYAALAILIAKSKYSDSLERRLGHFSLTSLFAVLGPISTLGFLGLLLLFQHHQVGAYTILALSLLICTVIGILVSFHLRQPESYRPAIAAIPIVLGLAPLCYALLFTPFRVRNEFLSLPEETILSNGKHVDNIDFINSNSFEGLFIPDPRLEGIKSPSNTIKIRLPRDTDFSVIELLEKRTPERFWYDRSSSEIEIFGHLKWDEYRYLAQFVQGDDLKKLQSKFASDSMADKAFSSKKYNKDELEFLKLNKPEFERQLVLGRFFYHHVFLFLPALEGVLDGAVVSASQYGRGLTNFFSEALKFSPENLRFNSYLALLYLSYPLYLVILLLIATKMGIRRWGLVFVGSLTLVGYIASDIETIRLGPGLAPWRHIFDVVTLFFMYLFVRRNIALYGVVLAAITGFSVYWSQEMGLFLAIAVSFGLCLRNAIEQGIKNWLWVGAVIFASMLGYWLGETNALTHPAAGLLGINTPQLPVGFIQILAGGALLAGAFLWIRRPAKFDQDEAHFTDWVLLGTSLAYIAICGIYLLWYPRPHHLAPVIPVIGLSMAIAYRRYGFLAKGNCIKLGATSIALTLLMLIFLGALRSLELRKETRIFSSHVVHEWNMPSGKITTTGQPELISESIDLIRKHELTNSVNILSPWEIVLLPFAGKYKAGPFMLSFDSLFSEAEIDQLAKSLVSSPSNLLFVDSRIMQGQYESPLSEQAYMDNRIFASVLRVEAHASLRKVFQVIQPCYDLLEKGRLISVYKRRPSARWSGEVCNATNFQP